LTSGNLIPYYLKCRKSKEKKKYWMQSLDKRQANQIHKNSGKFQSYSKEWKCKWNAVKLPTDAVFLKRNPEVYGFFLFVITCKTGQKLYQSGKFFFMGLDYCHLWGFKVGLILSQVNVFRILKGMKKIKGSSRLYWSILIVLSFSHISRYGVFANLIRW